MEKKKNIDIINGQLIDLEKASIEDLNKLEQELEEKEKEIRAKLEVELAKL